MPQTNDIKLGSNRSFGIVFFIVFFLISFYPLLNDENIRVWSLITSLIFLILGLLNSNLLLPLNKIWFKFGLLLGRIVSPLIMSIIFFLVVTPTAYIMRIAGKDLLNLKLNIKKYYWIEKKVPKSKKKNQL